MKKLKLTVEQKKAVDYLHKNEKREDIVINHFKSRGIRLNSQRDEHYTTLKELTTDELIRALYTPEMVEVEGEHKIGDIVYHENSGILDKVERIVMDSAGKVCVVGKFTFDVSENYKTQQGDA